MADQTLAQASSLKEDVPSKPPPKYTLRYKLAWRWELACTLAGSVFARDCSDVAKLVDLVFENQYFKCWQIRSELTALGEVLASRRPTRALEIGTAHGGTLLFLTRLASPKATIVSVDLPGGEFGGGYDSKRQRLYQRLERRRQHLRLLRGDSHSNEMLTRVKVAFEGQPLDYLFIDGDHRYEGVKRDFEMYGPLVGRGGVIAFHDIVEGPASGVGGVPKFWREIRSEYNHDEIVSDPQQGGFGIGLLYIE